MSDVYSILSKYLECKYSNISDEALSLRPICLEIDFSHKILLIRTQYV